MEFLNLRHPSLIFLPEKVIKFNFEEFLLFLRPNVILMMNEKLHICVIVKSLKSINTFITPLEI